MLEYAKKNDKFKVKSGVIEGRLCSVDEIETISKLPPRDILLGILAGSFKAPMAKLAGTLNASISQLGYALESLKTKRSVSE